MRRIFAILVFVVLVSCNSSSTQEKIQNLNGYWTISQVETKNGTTKDFGFAPVVDYIEIKNKKGFRKKVKPQLDGSYIVTNDVEQIKIEVENDSIKLYYSTAMDKWTETLVSSAKNEIIFKNEDGKVYTYKRFTGILDGSNGKAK